MAAMITTVIMMREKEWTMSDDKLIYFHKNNLHDEENFQEELFYGHHHDGDCDCGCDHDHDVDGFHDQIMKSSDRGLFSEESFDPSEVGNVVMTLYKECFDELLAISNLADEGKLEKALRRIRKLTELHREFYSGEEDLDERSLSLNEEVPIYRCLKDLRGEKDNLLLMPVPLHLMYFMWGMILCNLGKEEAAMKKLEWVCRLNPFFTGPYAAMNRYYEKHGDKKAWLDNIRREGKTIYAGGISEALAELGRYLALEGRIPEARACYGYVLDWNAETELPDGLTKEVAELLDSTDEEADLDAVLEEFGLTPCADPEVIEAMENAMKVVEKENDYELWESIQEDLFLLTKNESYFDLEWHGSDDPDFGDDAIFDEEDDVPLVSFEDEFGDTDDGSEKSDGKKESSLADDELPF